MAGALGVRLSGPRIYDGVAVEERWVGDGRSDAQACRHPHRAASSIARPAACRSACWRSCSVLTFFW